MSGWKRWRSPFPAQPEHEVEEELAFHLEERIADYVGRGMSPDEARRAASERLGDLAAVRRECTALLSAERRTRERRLQWAVSWLDVKLGLRMVGKHPALSVVSIAGMAVAIAVSTAYLTALGAMLDPRLPFDAGERVVALRNLDLRNPGEGRGASAEEFVAWRDGLRALRDVGAFRDDRRNLIGADGTTALVRVAEMSAAGFTLTRVPAALGRTLLPEDELPGATPVAVIGYGEWKRRFEGDERIVGRTFRLDDTAYTVVGVMPEGFGFPLDHGYWVPLPLSGVHEEPGAGSLEVFGRLADGVTLDAARAELALAGQRMAEAHPRTHAHLRPHLFYYPHAFVGLKNSPEVEAEMRAVQSLAGLVLLVVAVNVAVLVYARTASRAGEIAVRTALGASRARVVTQLFVEALVLCGAAAFVGLAIARFALQVTNDHLRDARGPDDEFPFWMQLHLTPGIVFHVALLTVVSAAIVGVLPALAVTGPRLQRGLQQHGTRTSSLDLGRTWTALIVLQVAVAVVGLPIGASRVQELLDVGAREPMPVAGSLLRTTLALAPGAKEGDRAQALVRRLEAEPDVASVALAQRFPGEEWFADVEIEPAAGAPPTAVLPVRTNHIGPTFLSTLDVPVLAGRALTPGDATSVLVDQTFAERVGGTVVGRRMRYAGRMDAAPGPWLEIAGVVPTFANRVTASTGGLSPMPRILHPATAAGPALSCLVVRMRGAATPTTAARVRDLATSVDPLLRLERLTTVADAWRADQRLMRFMTLAIVIVLASALMLSAAGIYAMMSFTVTKRRREIGIRAALGADKRRILAGIFSRASAQLGAGVLGGLVLAAVLDHAAGGDLLEGRGTMLLPATAVLMLAVGLLASLGPARRGLSVAPTEALREE